MRVDRGVFCVRRTRQRIFHVLLEIVEFFRAQGAFEYVEPAAPIGINDLLVQGAVVIESDRSPVAQLVGLAFSFADIRLQAASILYIGFCAHCSCPSLEDTALILDRHGAAV